MEILRLSCALLLGHLVQPTISKREAISPRIDNATNGNKTAPVPANGTGPEYASACSAAIVSFNDASSSWFSKHQFVKPTTQLLGGTTVSEVTYYANATTLCDGHARVTYSPAKILSSAMQAHVAPVTGTTTILATYDKAYPSIMPTCSIRPSDCDLLWSKYSASESAAQTMTPAPSLPTPPCIGVSAAASLSSVKSLIYGCGQCTIYGEGVQLVYFPTTVSRDMCASTPTASLTHYGPGAVITAYSGKNFTGGDGAGSNQTVVADGHTFTSGTAYISIATVYAADRCSQTFGTPVKNAILALPSESVLSLRYSQDHFQLLMETDQVTGYPVSYADFNTPIPWSAWNGQNICDPGGYGGWACSIVYEHAFRPQLAIPPQITDLSPAFKDCQVYYNGLYDPPLALYQASSIAVPTPLPGESTPSVTSTAMPSSGLPPPTIEPTALSESVPTPTAYMAGPTPQPSLPSEPSQHSNSYDPDSEPWVTSLDIDGHVVWATGANHEVKIGSVTCTSGGPVQTLADGTQVSYGSDGLEFNGHTTATFGEAEIGNPTGVATYILSGMQITANRETVLVDINGQTEVAVQSTIGGPIVFDGTMTLIPGGAPMTLSNGDVLSAATSGIVVEWTSTLGVDEPVNSGHPGHFSTKTSSAGSESTSASGSQEGTASTFAQSVRSMLYALVIVLGFGT